MAPIEWVAAVERPHTPLFTGFLFLGHGKARVERVTDLECGFQHLRKSGDVLEVDRGEMAFCRQVAEAKIDTDGSEFYERYAHKCYSDADRALSRCLDAASAAEANASNTNLVTAVDTFAIELLDYAPYLLVTLAIQDALEPPTDALVQRLHQRMSSEVDEAALRSVLLRPSRRPLIDAARDAEEALSREIAAAPPLAAQLAGESGATALPLIRAESPTIASHLDEYVDTYGWVPLNYFAGEPDTAERVLTRVLLRMPKLGRSQVEAPAGLNAAELAHSLSAEDRRLLATVQEYLFLRSFRLETFFRCHYALRGVWPVVGDHLDLSVDQLAYLTHPELLAALQDGRSTGLRQLAQERMGGYSVSLSDGVLVWGPPPAKLKSDSETEAKVTGQIGYPGNVRGITRIALRPEEAERLTEGNVLVTTMTTPAFGRGLVEVGGIVTDEGGLLCHAVSIAREFKTPCLIGTGTATKVFRDGDLLHLAASGTEPAVSRIPWRKGVRRYAPVLWRYFSTIGHDTAYVSQALAIASGLDSCKNVDHQTFLAEDEYEHMREQLLWRTNDQADYFDWVADRCYARSEELIAIAREIAAEVERELPIDRLRLAFARYHEAMLAIIPFRYGVLMLDEILTAQLSRMLQRYVPPGSDLDQVLQAAIGEVPPSFEQEYDEGIRVIADAFLRLRAGSAPPAGANDVESGLRGSAGLSQLAEDLLRDFAWIRTSYYSGDGLTLASIAQDVWACLAPNGAPATSDLSGRPPVALAAESRLADVPTEALSDAERKLLAVAARYVHLRSFRISVAYKADYIIRPLLELIAGVLDIPYDSLIQLAGDEIDRSLANEQLCIDRRELNARKEGFAFYLANGCSWLDDVTQGAGRLGYERASASEHLARREVTGQTVWPGIVKGPVRVILGKHDLDKLLPGDIIVSPMTTNDLTMAIRKNCVGIVTDEGGTMSHAAIISRESRIPCIVGTEVATSVFHDGDIVELNASEGSAWLVSE